MNQRDTTTETDDGPATGRSRARIDREGVAGAVRSVRRGVGSGLPAGVGGGLSLLRGVRAIRRGDREQGLNRLVLGGLLIGVAVAQRRSVGDRIDIDQTDVVSTAADIGDIERRGAGGGRHDSADETRAVAGTSIDIEGVDSSPELDSDIDASDVDQTDVVDNGVDEERLADAATETADSNEPDAAGGRESAERESYERLGGAAFDEHSSEIPVPQEAFDRTILSLSSEVFWGIREADDAVVVAQEFDPIQDGDGVRYVASTEIDGDRTLTIPDTVLNHWDAVAGGGMAVASGDEIAFLTTDSLQADSQLRLVPEQWLDDVLEDEE